MEYKNKYFKYKTKYLELSNNNIIQLGGKNRKLIIHICGSQGSGKTTLGNKLKDNFGDLIHLKDLDNLYSEFTNQNEISNFQEFINNYISNNNDKHLILTGLSANKCLGLMNNKDNTFYKIETKYKLFRFVDIIKWKK